MENNSVINNSCDFLFFKQLKNIYKYPIDSNDKTFKYDIENAWKENPLNTFKIILYWRDCKYGRGDCNSALNALLYIEKSKTKWFQHNFKIIPEYGTWLDLIKLWHFVSVQSKQLIMEYIIDTLENDTYSDNPSLLSKWIPSENSKWDRIKQPRFIIELCKELFQVKSVKSYHIAILRKEIISPLRNKLYIVETKLCKKEKIDYNKVPLLAMYKYKNTFLKKDKENYEMFLSAYRKVNKNIKYFLCDLINQYINGQKENIYIETEWEHIKQSYTFDNSIAICDVSGSMYGIYLELSIALGLLCKYNNYLIEFDEIPSLYYIPDSSLYNQVKHMKNMEWGDKINYDFIINMINESKFNINTIYVFTDMPFEKGVIYNYNNSTRKQYKKTPKMIYWNFCKSMDSEPILYLNKNILILNGFSPILLNFILKKDKNITRDIIESFRYDLVTKI